MMFISPNERGIWGLGTTHLPVALSPWTMAPSARHADLAHRHGNICLARPVSDNRGRHRAKESSPAEPVIGSTAGWPSAPHPRASRRSARLIIRWRDRTCNFSGLNAAESARIMDV